MANTSVMRVPLILFCAIALLTAPCAAKNISIPQQALLDTAETAKVDADVQAFLRGEHIEGATIAVVKAGSIVYERSFGLRDVAAGLSADAQTKYEAGSITKQFTAAAILQLKEAGAVNLDALLATYLPGIPHAKEVTIRQLLTNTSGLHEYMDQPKITTLVHTPTTFDALMAEIASKPLDFKPGTQFEHSNTNYLVLGRVIEVASGEPWEHYVQEHLFAPAGMNDTSTLASEARLSNMAVGYTFAKDQVARTRSFDESWAASAGDIITTVGDLVKWHEALASGRIISTTDSRLLTTTPRLADGSISKYGFGAYVSTFEGQPIVLAQGDTFGFDASDLFFPKQGVRVIVLMNTESAESDGSISEAERIYNDLFPAIAAAAHGPPNGSEPTSSVEAFYAAALQKMVKLPQPAYASYDISVDAPGQHLSLIRSDGGPFLKLGGKGTSHLSSDAIFRNQDGRTTVKLDDGTYAATYYSGFLGATWSALHDWMRYGGDHPADDESTAQPHSEATSLRVIAAVTSLGPGNYRVIDAGAARCSSGSSGHMVHLIARADPERHPLTDATIDLQTGRFCMMRFTITHTHLRCLNLCTGTVELDFGDAGQYSIIRDAHIVVTWRVAGIKTGAVAETVQYSNFTFPSSVDPQLFVNPKE